MSSAAAEFAPWLGAFETLRVVGGKPLFVAEHLRELRRALEVLGLDSKFDPRAESKELPKANGRWRWLVTPEGARTLFSQEEPPVVQAVDLCTSSVRVGSSNWDARFKTVSYLVHAQAAREAGPAEAVLLNERGEVASAGKGNLFWRRGGRLFTPAHEAGCRCGVVRGFVLQLERVETGFFPAADLAEADEIFSTGSVRGIVPAARMDGRPLPSSEWAQRMQMAYEQEVARQLAA